MSYNLSEEKNPKYFISWGCGVQSTTLCVMSALGDIKKIDYVITADTGWERSVTYQVRDWYIHWLQEHNISVHIVQEGNILTDVGDHSDLPLWYGKNKAPLQRQCTAHYKIVPIRRKMRELMGLRTDNKGRTKKNSAILYMGISLDEAQRMADSNRTWIKNEYPLIDLKMTRQDCIQYLKDKGLPVPPKSACIGCPYTGADRWLELKNKYPEEFQQAVAFDESIRIPKERMLSRGFTEKLYVWKKCIPLAEENFEQYVQENALADLCDSGYCWI